MTDTAPDILTTVDLSISRGRLPVVFDVTLGVPRGAVVALVGPNGAGKTTFVEAVAGLIPARGGHVTIDNVPVRRVNTSTMIDHGLSLAPQGRRLFPEMTVEDNLLLGGSKLRRRGRLMAATLDDVLETFPQLRSRLSYRASFLSGGEQQMVAVARSLMSRPRLLVLDEPSHGLAPLAVHEMMTRIAAWVQEGDRSVLIVEQNLEAIRGFVSKYFFMAGGRIVSTTGSEGLLEGEALAAYFSAADY